MFVIVKTCSISKYIVQIFLFYFIISLGEKAQTLGHINLLSAIYEQSAQGYFSKICQNSLENLSFSKFQGTSLLVD